MQRSTDIDGQTDSNSATIIDANYITLSRATSDVITGLLVEIGQIMEWWN